MNDAYRLDLRQAVARAGVVATIAVAAAVAAVAYSSIEAKNMATRWGLFSLREPGIEIGQGIPVYLNIWSLLAILGAITTLTAAYTAWKFTDLQDYEIGSLELATIQAEQAEQRKDEAAAKQQLEANMKKLNEKSLSTSDFPF